MINVDIHDLVKVTHRPILIGMNNPYRQEPRYALFPAPERSAGYRLWAMLREVRSDLYRKDYVDGFDRRNLVTGAWSSEVARRAADAIDLPDGARVVLLGREVQRAFNFPTNWPVGDPFACGGQTWYALPHPSGRCLEYNNPLMRRRTGELLADLYEEWDAKEAGER